LDQHKTTSERIDDLPLLIYWLKHMQVDVIIDQVLGPPHGNWEGLSYGEVALVFVAYVLMCCTHFLSPMQEWASKHLLSLSQALGKPVREADFTDDRLGVILSRLGDGVTLPGEQIELELGQHLVRAYALPTETVRIDTTTVSVHHQPETEDGLMKFGRSKDHRPDLRQFKQVLGTLDPVGLPLATAVVSGEQADDPQYLPTWKRLVAVIGHADFLTVGDCKLASLANRAQIHAGNGFYLTPLPMTGNTPAELEAWVLNPPNAPRAIRLPDQARSEPAVGQGFEVKVECIWQNPDTSETVTWLERRLVLQSEAHAQRQQAGVRDRLTKAETALRALKPASAQADLEKRAQAILTRYAVADYLEVRYTEHIERQTRYLGGGRPGPNRPTQTVETHTWAVKPKRRRAALNRFDRLAGWRVYVTNTSARRLSSAGAVNCYRQEWQPEHGFHRLKGGVLAITPLFLKDDNRIRGLVLLLGIALRALTLTEFVVRRGLATSGETLKGLYAGNPNRATDQPTAERLLKAFDDITLYRHASATKIWYEVTELSPLQRRILKLMQVPESVFDPPLALIDNGCAKMAER
jgi:transposase